MNRTKSLLKTITLAVLVVSFIGSAGLTAQEFDNKPVADEMIGSSGITWVPKINYSQLVLTISRPDGTVFSKTIEAGSTPYADLSEVFGKSYSDGSYTYELRVIPVAEKKVRGLKIENTQSMKALTQSGAFLVKGGGIVTPVGTESNISGTSFTTQESVDRTLDQVINDDLIVIGSACIGQDCVNGENFGFDTLRLKENNLRIKFQDTSNSGSFPSNDWQITANDSSNGGANKFSIDDIDGGKTPFTIEAAAPSNSLYVDDGGRVGFGTSTPVVELHVKDGDSPTLRLEQDGSSGFTAQTWDVAGNEANFFVRDVTHSSHLPFRIKPGSGNDNALYIDSDGDIGFRTTNPSYPVHLLTDSSTNADIAAQKSGGATVFMSAGNSFGFFGTPTGSNFPVRINVNGGYKMQLNADNSLEMQNGATCTTTGVWTNNSSRELKENITSLSLDEAMDTLNGLNPVRFNYKVEKDEEYVGFIAEDVPELVAMKDRKHLVSMDVVAVLTKVVKEQQKTISELKEKVAALEKK